jgi:hypothetical protein
MPIFKVRPVEAVQFTGRESNDAVAELVGRYRPQVSWESNPQLGTLRFHGTGSELTIEMNSWVVVFGGNLVVMSPSVFEETMGQQLAS